MGRREARAEIRYELGLEPGAMMLTVSDLVRLTSLSDKTIRRRIDSGEIRSSTRMDGKNILIPIDEAVRLCMV